MHVEARMLGEPFLDDGMLVSGVVVGNEMQRLVLRRLAVDLFQASRARTIPPIARWLSAEHHTRPVRSGLAPNRSPVASSAPYWAIRIRQRLIGLSRTGRESPLPSGTSKCSQQSRTLTKQKVILFCLSLGQEQASDKYRPRKMAGCNPPFFVVTNRLRLDKRRARQPMSSGPCRSSCNPSTASSCRGSSRLPASVASLLPGRKCRYRRRH